MSKKYLSLVALFFFIFTYSILNAQAPSIGFDKTLGGSSTDNLRNQIQTSDGGFLLGGFSSSNISGDKTENSKGGNDYWIVKTNASGTILWDKTIGGSGNDVLFSLTETSDGGFLLGGYSNSSISGDKTENSKGQDDFWIVKTNASGTILWDKTIGGSGSDVLFSLTETSDYGFLLGGYSFSNISGDKTQNSKGNADYWIVKTNVLGTILWDKTIGGSGNDYEPNVTETSDGGFLLGGYSNSNISGDKTQNSKGFHDFWIVKNQRFRHNTLG